MRIETNDPWGQFMGSSDEPVKDGERRWHSDNRDYRGDSGIYNTADHSLFPLLPQKKQVRVFHTLIGFYRESILCLLWFELLSYLCYQVSILIKMYRLHCV